MNKDYWKTVHVTARYGQKVVLNRGSREVQILSLHWWNAFHYAASLQDNKVILLKRLTMQDRRHCRSAWCGAIWE